MRHFGSILLVAGALMILAGYNGGPLYFYDSLSYVGPGISAFNKLVHGIHSGTYGGRSQTYALLVYLTSAPFSIWGLVFAHCFATAFVLHAVCRKTLAHHYLRPYLFVAAGLILATSLPWFACMLQPDIFTALVPLLAFLIAFDWADRSRWIRITYGVLYVVAISAHPTHLLIAVFLSALLGAGLWLLPAAEVTAAAAASRNLAGVAASVLLTVLINFGLYGQIRFNSPHTLPILMARTIYDGPGKLQLDAMCATGASTRHHPVCRYAGRIGGPGFREKGELLWGRHGVVKVSTLEERRQFAQIQFPFLLKSIGRAPLMQLRASLKHFYDQLFEVGIGFVGNRPLKDRPSKRPGYALKNDVRNRFRTSQQAKGNLPVAQFDRISQIVVLLTLALSLVLHIYFRERIDASARRLFALCLGAVIVNAAVTGALSGPLDRFGSRIVWVLPPCFFLTAFSLIRARSKMIPAHQVARNRAEHIETVSDGV